MFKHSVGLAGLLAVATLGLIPATGQAATYSGRFSCDDRGTIVGMPGARVEIWDRGFNINDFPPPEITGHVFARGFTDEDGRFSITGPARDARVFARVVFHDAFDVSLNDWATPWDWANDSQRRDSRNGDVDFGDTVLTRDRGAMGSPRCAVFRGMHRARVAWQQEVGTDVPNHAREIGWNYPNAATFGRPPARPFMAGTGLKWPDNSPVGGGDGDTSVALHEFGHSIRHGYDGGLIHFLGDVLAFDYLNHHHACARYNEGFAFNEGWAEYWAGDHGDPGCHAVDDYAVEGRVAQALKDLEVRCAGGDRRVLLEVLRLGGYSSGGIHSFRQFRDAMGCPRPLPADAPPPPPPPPSPPEPVPTVPGTTAVSNLQRAIRTVNARIGSGAVPLRLSCTSQGSCLRQAGTPLRRVVLGGQLEMLRRQRAEVTFIASRAGRAQLRKLGPVRGFRLLDRRERALERALETIQRRMVRRLVRLTSGRPGLAAVASGARRALGALDRRGATPLPLDLPSFDVPRFVALPVVAPVGPVSPQPSAPGDPGSGGQQPQQPQQPQPQPQEPQQPPLAKSSITLSCPAAGKPKGTAAWSGQLLPARTAGVTVQVTGPEGQTTTSTVTTDASGVFSGSFETTTAGTWTLTASTPGDATYTASTDSCDVAVG